MIPRIWPGAECWIVAGGFSVVEQFGIPYDLYWGIVNGEVNWKAVSFYLEPIHNKHVIGVNLAGLLGSWIDILYFRDCEFYDYYKEYIQEHFEGGLRFSSCNKKTIGREVLCLPECNKNGISVEKGQVCWNADSGAAAINLAVQLGAVRIILVGYDMAPGPDGEKRWHGNHLPAKKNQAGQPFFKFKNGYEAVARDAQKLGIDIINTNSWSAI